MLIVELCLWERGFDGALERVGVRATDRVGHFFRIALLEVSDQDLVERGVIDAERLLVFSVW